MSDISRVVLDAEEIPASDDAPRVGQWVDFVGSDHVTADHRYPLKPDERSGVVSATTVEYAACELSDADGPVLKLVEDEYGGADVTRRLLACVVHVGSNYAEIATVGGHSWRIHLDTFWEECTPVADPDARLAQGVDYWRARLHDATQALSATMAEVGLSGRQIAPATQALAHVVGNSAGDEYKDRLKLVKASLPALHAELRESGKWMGKWMAAKALPLRATHAQMQTMVESIDRRLLAVDLYTALSEENRLIREGEPAKYAEPLHLMQRMHFMDEECIAFYRAGGMSFDSIREFDRWVASAEHFERLFPHPRTVVAFRVRREMRRDRHVSFGDITDKYTYLYVRNGEQLYGLSTAMKFEEALFPDVEHTAFLFDEELWATEAGEVVTIGAIEAMQAELKVLRREERRLRKIEKHASAKDKPRAYSEAWSAERSADTLAGKIRAFSPFNRSNLHFDELSHAVELAMEQHNRLAVLLQGLFDRSEVLHPHPPVQLWQAESFARSVVLVYDQSRALTDGPPPDFEAYRARLNASIGAGSYTVGQYAVWFGRESAKWADARDRDDHRQFRPTAENPGPPEVAPVEKHTRTGKSTFVWDRLRLREPSRWSRQSPTIATKVTVDDAVLLNVSAYKPGDYRQFFADPRTRQDYLKWAPLMMAAEDWYAAMKPRDGDDT